MNAYHSSFQQKKFSQNHHKRKSVAGKVFGIMFGILLVVFLVAAAGFIFFSNNKDTGSRWGSEKLLFNVAGPDSVASGGEVEYKIKLENQGNINLQEGELSITFPEGFSFVSSEPKFDQDVASGGIWKIAEIKAAEIKEFSVKGQLFGEVETTKVISLAMNYRPENFSSSFLATSSYETKIGSSLLDLSYDLGDEIMGGQEIESTIKITKSARSEFDANRLKVVVEYPDGVELVKSSYPEDKNQEGTARAFILDDFGNSASLKLTSIFSGDDNEKKVILIHVYSLDSNDVQSPEIVQLRKVIYLSKPALSLELLANNSAASSQDFKWQDPIEFKINYQNNWDQPIEDLMLTLTFEGADVFDWESVKFYGNLNSDYINEVDRGQTFVFNKFVAPDFVKLEAGQSANVRFKMNLDEKAVNASDSSVTIKAELSSKGASIKSNEVNLNIK
ncbi:MAG: hypothetical protein WCX88_04030 [Patescibacteria group bacterium]